MPKKKPGRKRTKLSKTSILLANLPKGFTYNGPPGHCNEIYVMSQLKNDMMLGNQDDLSACQRLDLTTDSESRTLTIGSFRIDIDEVRVADLKSMRKLLPRPEYKLLKNRKCARLSRYRRKEQTSSLLAMNRKLKEENSRLRFQLGLPSLDDHTYSIDSSDDAKDSGGANCLDDINEDETLLE